MKDGDTGMGANFRFVHCADLHLGSRFRGVSEADPASAERMRDSVFESFSRIVDRALESKADAMFIAGDAFDEGTITPKTRMFLAEELGRLGIPVFMAKGNHDPWTSWESSIPFPENVHVFGSEPEKLEIPGVEGAEAVGVSFANWHEERNLPSMLSGTPGKFSVACVHCDVDRATPDYDYAPCSLSDLKGRGIDYWAIGHIHKRSVLCTDPWVVYPGNIQGRSFKECGEKGAYLVDVKGGRVSEAKFFPTQGIVWYDEVFDVTGRTFYEVLDEMKRSIMPGSIARLTFVGSGEMDGMLRRDLRSVSNMLGSQLKATVSEIDVQTAPAVDIDARRSGNDMAGTLIRAADSIKASGREKILGIIASNPLMKEHMSLFGCMDDEKLCELVDESLGDILSRMEGAR